MEKLESLKGNSVTVSPSDEGLDDGAVLLVFSEGTVLRTDYWRLSKEGRAQLSSFDHGQKYGLSAPMNAIEILKEELDREYVTEARLDAETGDIIFDFTNALRFQALNFTAYEVWYISFPDGIEEYSNYAK